MWQVSVPSWDDDPASGSAQTQKGQKRKKSAPEGSSSSGPELFQLTSASLEGDAAVQVTKVIAEAEKKKGKRNRKSTDSSLTTANTQGTQIYAIQIYFR